MIRHLFSRFGQQRVSGKVRRGKRQRATKRPLGVVTLGLERMEDRRLLAAGDLDATFGSLGIVVDSLSGVDDSINAVATQVVGGETKILIAGYKDDGNNPQTRDVLVGRYNADGTRDTTFGTGGVVIINADTVPGGDTDVINHILVDDQNRIMLFGGARTRIGTTNFTGALVMRLTESGQLDTTFDGDGQLITVFQNSLGQNLNLKSPDTTARVVAAAFQPDGKFVVGSTIAATTGTRNNFVVARYNGDGTLDASFGAGVGYVITDFDGLDDDLADLTLQSDGKIVAVGTTTSPGSVNDFAVARYNTDGSLDLSFGVGGLVRTNIQPSAFLSQDLATSVYIEPDGQIVVGGTAAIRNTTVSAFQRDLVIARYNSDGSLDDASDATPGVVFGPTPGLNSVPGTVRIDFGGNFNDLENSFAMIVQPDGKYVIGGRALTSTTSPTIFTAARVLPGNGALDPTFGTGGKTTAAFPSHTFLTMNDLTLQPDGKILGVGFMINPAGARQVAMARWESGLLVADAGGPYTIDEPGGTITLNGSGIGAGTLTFEWDLDGDGIYGETGAAALFGDEVGATPSFTVSAVDGPTVFPISLRVSSDENGDMVIDQVALDSSTVTVVNVAPTVTADFASVTVDEGDMATNTGTFADVGPDAVTLSASVGTVIDTGGGTWSWTYDTADGPDDSQTVTITATDDDGDFSEVTFQLVVNNVAPTVTADNDPVVVNEGDTASNAGTYADVGADTVTLSASVGVIIDNLDGTWSWSYDTTDGPDETQLVTITATDSDGASSIATFQLTVNNVAPTVAADAASVAVDEGATASNTGTYADVGADTVTLSASVGVIIDNLDGTWSWSYDTTDGPDETQLVTITATDSDGASSIATFQLTVNNVAPVLTISGAASVDEAAVYTLNLSSLDPGTDTITSWTINWGDSVEVVTGNPASVTHTYADGPNSYTISATATDEDGTYSSNSISVTVNNVAPTANAGGPYFTFDDAPIALSGSGSDVAGAADPLTFTWDLDGDGVFGETGGAAARGDEVGANPVFDPAGLSTGSYTVTLRVSDGDGGVTDATAQINVLASGTLLIDGTLYIIGTEQHDIVAVSRQSNNIKVVATFNDDNPQLFTLASVTKIDIRVRGGNDVVVITNSVTVPTTIDGGSGNDVLTAGGGDTVIYGGSGDDVIVGGPGNNALIGGSGTDVISGGSGRDLLIGGFQSDLLSGGGGDDILIGGWTIYDENTDSNRAAIDAIMAVWTSSSSFNARVATLTGDGGLLEANEAVFDDDACDLLVGGGGRDLLFADTNLWDGSIDLATYNWLQDALVPVN